MKLTKTIIFVAILTLLMSMSVAVNAVNDDEPPTVSSIHLYKR